MKNVKQWFLTLPMWLRITLVVVAVLLLPFLAIAAFFLAIPALVIGMVGVFSGKVTWGPFATKTSSAIVAGVSAAVLIAGGAFASTATHPSSTAAAQSSSVAATESASDSPAVESAESEPVDPDTVPATGMTLTAATVANSDALSNKTAADVLATLPIKGRAPKTGYTRSQFGAAWTDVDRNGCDTRNDVLKRDLTGVTYKDSCKISTGTLVSAYSGSTVTFVRGAGTSTQVQIDHLVALSDAWQKGAQQIAAGQRLALANDPLNLQAVEGRLNEQKGDGDAATWLPPLKSYRCEYVARQVSVKSIYGLWVTQAEHDAIANILATCPQQKAYPSGLTSSAAAPSSAAPTPAPSATPTPQPSKTQTTTPAPAAPAPAAPAPAAPAPVVTTPPPAAGDGDVYYKNCDAVRAAGKAPLYAGQPGYSLKLDRDKDGVACE